MSKVEYVEHYCPECGEVCSEYFEGYDDGTQIYEVPVYECSDKIDYTENWSNYQNSCNYQGPFSLTKEERDRKFGKIL